MARLDPYQDGARVRVISKTITYSSQVSGTEIAIGTLPESAAVKSLELTTSDSTSTATLAIGVSGTAGKYRSAAALTDTDQPVKAGNADALLSPLASSEDVILTTGTAALPASGTLHVVIEYLLD